MSNEQANTQPRSGWRRLDAEMKNTGFTLLEVLLTLMVLGILLAQVVPRYGTSTRFTLDQTQHADLVRLEGAVELYRLDTGILPERLENLRSLPSGVSGWRGPYLDPIPTQPDGSPYTLDAQGKVGL